MTFRKILLLILLNVCLLGACGSNEKKDHSGANKHINTFKNDKLVTKNVTVKIKEMFIINNRVSNKKEIVFEFEIKRTGGKQIVPTTFFLSNFYIEQDSKQLVTGFAANTMTKYDKSVDNGQRVVKSGQTLESIISYELEGEQSVKIQAFEKSKNIDLSSLKTVNHPVKP